MSKGKKIETFNTLKDLGNQKFKAKEYEKAKEFYTKAINLNQDLALIYANRAQCNLNLRNYYDALNDCNIAIRHDPAMTKAYYRRAVALKELYRFRLAMKDFERVLRDEPGNQFAKKEIDAIRDILESDTRIEMKLPEKPEIYRSKKVLDTFTQSTGKYTASHLYQE